MKYSGHGRYLIQRGTFKKDIKEITGIDSIVGMDYMGAAEYEFGSLPQSLKRIVASYRKRNLIKHMVTILEKSFILYLAKYSSFDVQDIITVLISLAEDGYKSKYSVKMGSHLHGYFIGQTITQLKKGCIKKTEEVDNYIYCNFWWDIDHDWVLIPSEFDYMKKMDTALQKLLERNFDKK